MTADLLDQVRASCRAVAQRATHVHINCGRVASYAASLPLEQAGGPQIDPNAHYLGQGRDTLAFFLTLDSINFGSGYFPHLRKRPGMSGYFTVASSLCDYYRKHGALSAEQLAGLGPEDCARIFGQDLTEPVAGELMGLFASALNQLGRHLLDRFSGSFVGLVDAAKSRAEQLVRLLIEMPYFRDVEAYEGLHVAFYKRAQITAADVALAFGGRGFGRFDDLRCLTAFADNLVPHVLRTDGVLRYEQELSARIDAGELIPPGSAEEVEIRACGVHTVELLAEELRRSGRCATPMELDHLLWNRGQGPHFKKAPRHRTRTVYY